MTNPIITGFQLWCHRMQWKFIGASTMAIYLAQFHPDKLNQLWELWDMAEGGKL